MRLSDLKVRTLPTPERGQKSFGDDQLSGFSVRVSQGGTKTFTLMVGRDRQLITIGRYPTISLADARAEAKRLLAERTLGKHRPKRLAFEDAITLFVAEKRKKNKARTIDENERILKKYCVSLHRKSLEDITTHDITKITDKLSKTPGTALHTFWALRTFLRWCAKRSYLDRNPIERLEAPHPTKFRERVLSDEELRAVWKATDDCGQFGTIVKLLIVTGQRRSEIGSLKAEWCSLPSSKGGVLSGTPAPIAVGGEDTDCEVNPRPSMAEKQVTNDAQLIGPRAECTITIPSEFTKNRRSHTFPVGLLAARSLSAMEVPSGFIFPARGATDVPFNGWSKAKAQLEKKVSSLLAETGQGGSKSVQPWTLHDLRRTYATNLQRLGIKLEVIEALLNHVSGTRAGIVGVYNRHRYEAEMREAVNIFESWFTRTIINA